MRLDIERKSGPRAELMLMEGTQSHVAGSTCATAFLYMYTLIDFLTNRANVFLVQTTAYLARLNLFDSRGFYQVLYPHTINVVHLYTQRRQFHSYEK